MNILIAGAGASGLMAGSHLASAGHHITIIEARDRIGGRVHSFKHEDYTCEGGAEFIHGNLKITLGLLKEAGIKKIEIAGDFWYCRHSEWKMAQQLFANEDLLEKRLKDLDDNITIAAFLQREFKEERFADLRQSVLGYVQGYFAADPEKQSAKLFYKEWMAEDEQQYRVGGGYYKMLEYLQNNIESKGGKIIKSSPIKNIEWQQGKVRAVTANGSTYDADKIIVTVPLGVWQDDELNIKYTPTIAAKSAAAKKMGFGYAIKILLHFEHAFWLNEPLHKRLKANISNFSFVISDEHIPTFWTQNPHSIPLLTGWLAGPRALEFINATDDNILEETISSLSKVFSIDAEILKKWLKWSKVFNWPAEEFTRGGYSYSTTETETARRQLAEPIESTLYFAGEGLYEGTETGTVEAALFSGQSVAQQILADINA